MRTYLPSQLTTAALLLTAALATWIVTVSRMRGMDAGPAPTSARSAGTSASG
jgi:hypothetical protein